MAPNVCGICVNSWTFCGDVFANLWRSPSFTDGHSAFGSPSINWTVSRYIRWYFARTVPNSSSSVFGEHFDTHVSIFQVTDDLYLIFEKFVLPAVETLDTARKYAFAITTAFLIVDWLRLCTWLILHDVFWEFPKECFRVGFCFCKLSISWSWFAETSWKWHCPVYFKVKPDCIV